MLGLVGLGRWGRNLGRNFRRLGALVAVCDHHHPILKEFQFNEPGLRCYTDYEQLLADSEVTAIAIATGASTHYSLSRICLEQGKDVFCEKPFCLSLAEAIKLHELAVEKKRVLMVGHLLHYHSAIIELKRLVQAGALGEIFQITSNRLNLGILGMEGGALWDLAPHDISVILALLHPQTPVRVRGIGNGYFDPDAVELGMVALEFSGGAQANVHFSWLHPYKDHRLTVMGSEGIAVFDDTAPLDRKLQLYRSPFRRDSTGKVVALSVEPHYPSLSGTEPLYSECSHFLECCASRHAPITDSAEATRVTRVIAAGVHSMHQGGKTVTLEDACFFEKDLDIRLSAIPL